MAVTIRLQRHGRKAAPFYRIVAADSKMKRDGRYLELLGTVDPLTNPATFNVKEERVKYWVGVGAQTSDTAGQYLQKAIPGYLEELIKGRVAKVQALRAKRKARAKKAA